MKTYRQKLEELRLKSLQIVEDGLSDDDPSQFSNAALFIAFAPADVLDQELPDVLDAEEIEEKEKETKDSDSIAKSRQLHRRAQVRSPV